MEVATKPGDHKPGPELQQIFPPRHLDPSPANERIRKPNPGELFRSITCTGDKETADAVTGAGRWMDGDVVQGAQQRVLPGFSSGVWPVCSKTQLVLLRMAEQWQATGPDTKSSSNPCTISCCSCSFPTVAVSELQSRLASLLTNISGRLTGLELQRWLHRSTQASNSFGWEAEFRAGDG